jgi:glycosyltransferase involved in cell wall biosynthesis
MRASIGAKRNLACRQARGQVIAHWDDDDWYAPDRLRYQAAPIISGEADLTGLVNNCVLELPGGDFWTTTPELHPRMFVGDVHGGTLVFRASLLETGIRYPETSLAEDASLIRQALARRGRLLRLSNPGLFVYVRHGANAWREYAPGSFLDPEGWRRIPHPATFPAPALAAYRSAARKR